MQNDDLTLSGIFQRRYEEAIWFWSNYWPLPLMALIIIAVVYWIASRKP